MNEQLKQDAENLEKLLNAVKEQGLDFLQHIAERPTTVSPVHTSADRLQDVGIGAMNALALFNKKFEKIIVASAGPRYLGFVTGGTTPAAIMGDWLTSVYDQNTQSTQGQGDISATIEIETIQLLLNLLELPQHFKGGFVTGATMSNFTCLAVARQWIGKCFNKDFARQGISQTIQILSAVPHSSAVKSLSMLGMGSGNVQLIETESGNRESMDMADLEKRMALLQGEPFILITSGGTVNTVDFDNFNAISKLKNKYSFWWHVDAAFGAFAACSPTHKHLLEGWENADSLTVDCHKWLNVPYESAVFLIKEKHATLQMETFQNSNAPYLGNPNEQFSYLNFLPENSRRLKALPTWFTLRAYGKKGYQEIVENSIACAQSLGKFIETSTAFELLAPVRLNNVCFTLRGDENQHKVSDFLIRLNSGAKVFMTPTIYKNKKGIRASFVNWRTNEMDIRIIANEMMKAIEGL